MEQQLDGMFTLNTGDFLLEEHGHQNDTSQALKKRPLTTSERM
jgi:hypothetical protein